MSGSIQYTTGTVQRQFNAAGASLTTQTRIHPGLITAKVFSSAATGLNIVATPLVAANLSQSRPIAITFVIFASTLMWIHCRFDADCRPLLL